MERQSYKYLSMFHWQHNYYGVFSKLSELFSIKQILFPIKFCTRKPKKENKKKKIYSEKH